MSDATLVDAMPRMPAALRLRASRERLRDAMTPPPEPEATPPPPAPPTLIGRWLTRLRAYPLVGEVSEALGHWWRHHPLRPAMRLAGGASTAAVTPVAQQHPYALVLVAAIVGALLMWTRPWKWALRSAVFAGLVPQLASQLLKKMPIDTWLTMLGTIVASGNRRRSPPAATYPAAYVPAAPASRP